MILVNAKKQGLSFEELNEFRVRDFVEFSNIYYDNQATNSTNNNYVKEPTQKDIDKLLS